MLGVRGERPATGTRIALLGLVGVAFYCATQNAGLLFADATTASLLGGMIPIFTVCLAVPVLGERYDAARFAGIAVSLVGIAWIVLPDADRPTGAAIGAAALPLASAFGSALSVVLGRRAHASGPALAIVTGSAMYGLLFLLPGAVVETAAVGVTMPGRNEVVALLYLGAGCSALAFVLRGYGLAHLEAGHGAVFGNLRPVMGVALAVLLLGEPLTGAQVAGGALVLAGVTIASRPWPSRRARRASPEPALALAAGPASTSMS
jgi:probable blue pigment (indigoidine) exporter